MSINALRTALAVAGLGLAALIGWAVSAANFWQSFDGIVADPWGLVTLVDLYLGLAVIAVLICFFERNWTLRLFWAAPLFFLGNVWTVVWLLWRSGDLFARLRRP